jgi:DNA-binding response OmpR family regulator
MPAVPPPPAYNLFAVKVLIVDSNRFMRQIIRQVLHALNIRRIQEAADSGEAFKILKTFDADIVTVDYNVTPLNGIEFAKMVRTAKDSPNPYVPIIMVTAYAEQAVVCQSRDAGIDEFLTKPISAQSLYARIVAVIDRRRPFIRCKSYFGPDRHRRDDSEYQGPRKREGDKDDGWTVV